jgi:diguanylate cyclase (GGDEF)-like protein
MRFISIFSGRGRTEPAPAADAPPDGAARAAALFGVPQAHMTREVRAAFNAVFGEIDALRLDIDELKMTLAQSQAAADHDPLVPVYNRRAFVRETTRVAALVRRHEVEASLIYFDLNGFKAVNDLHGHAAGDQVLRAIGEILIRQTRETDVVGRIGGDEFAVVLTHVGPEAARAKAEALAAALRSERMRHDGVELSVAASYGVTDIDGTETAERILARADEAMYADKALHRRASA